jgi:hypothetical protein
MPKNSEDTSKGMPNLLKDIQSLRISSPAIKDRMSDIALRKKKNADAQAAFRARRANYIATLEETGTKNILPYSRDLFISLSCYTVTSLESVVLQLQDSCRETRAEAQELRQQNASLRHEYREREKFWRTLWQSRKTGENEELPPLPQPMLNGHMGSSQLHTYGAEGMAYRSHDDPSMCSGYNANTYSHSPSMQYAAGDVSNENSSHSLTQRGAKYGPYSYNVHGSHRDHSWQQNIGQNTSSGGESGPPTSAHSSNSPSFGESPTLTSSSDLSVPFSGRFGEDAKVPVNNLDTVPYVFPGSRSISPSSTTPSSSSASLTSPFQFTFPDGTVPHERSEFDYRRNSNPRPDGLHAPSAEVSLSGPGSDAVRYRLGTRRADSSADRPMLPILPPLSMGDSGSHHDRGSSDGDSNSYGHSRLRPRRDSTIAISPPSRSASPSAAPPLSGTLAVIKAQAFGALRRTRARTKKPSDAPAKTAMDVLEARGIEMGAPSGAKRQRTEDSEDGEMQQTQ